MAAQPATAKKQDSSDARATRIDSQAADLAEFLRQYSPTQQTAARDILKNRYRIELSSPLPALDSRNAKAYAATDTEDSAAQLYALVCRHGTYQRQRAMQALKDFRHPNVLPLIDFGVMHLSQPQEDRLVIIHQRPSGKKLSQLINEVKEPLGDYFLSRQLVAPIASAIHELSQIGITHGLINPEKIYFSDRPILGECVSEPCGLSQPFYFETVDRMQALPYAKGEGSSAVDFYALAVLMLLIQLGVDHVKNLPPPTLAHRILREGAINVLIGPRDTSELFYDLYKGMLGQQSDDRWNYRYVKSWLEGKRYNVLVPPVPVEATRPFDFAGFQVTNRRELAHLLFQSWDEITEIVLHGHLQQWVAVSVRDKEASESVARIAKSISQINRKNEAQLFEQLMRVLILFDPDSPIRIGNLAFHVDGIDSLCAELIQQNDEKSLQLLSKFIEYDMVAFWTETQMGALEKEIPEHIDFFLKKLEKMRGYMRNTGFGFGVERMLYDLNLHIPCLSPLLAKYHVTNLKELVFSLDAQAPRLCNEHDPIDRHIAAFCAGRLALLHEVRLHELVSVPSLAASRTLMALRLLSASQQRASVSELYGLSHWIGLRLMPALVVIKSNTLKSELSKIISEHAREGYLPSMADVMINGSYATADQSSFHSAKETYRRTTLQIDAYRKHHLLEERTNHLAHSLSKLLAYGAFVLTLIIVLRHG